MHLQWGKRVQVNARRDAFHGAADLEILLPGIARMNAALHANFGGAARPGLRDAFLDFTEREIVRTAAQVLAHFAFGEGAEAASEIADIRIVEIAGDDIGDGVADSG